MEWAALIGIVVKDILPGALALYAAWEARGAKKKATAVHEVLMNNSNK